MKGKEGGQLELDSAKSYLDFSNVQITFEVYSWENPHGMMHPCTCDMYIQSMERQILMCCIVFTSSYGPNFRPSFWFISQAMSAFKLQLLYKLEPPRSSLLLRLFIRFQNSPSSTFVFLSFPSFFVFAPPSPLPFHLRVSFAFSTRLLPFLPFLALVVQLRLGWVWMVLHLILGVAL